MMSEWSTGFLSREYVCHSSLFTTPFPRGGADAGEAERCQDGHLGTVDVSFHRVEMKME